MNRDALRVHERLLEQARSNRRIVTHHKPQPVEVPPGQYGPGASRGRAYHPPTADQLRRMLELRAEGKRLEEIAAAAERSPNYVRAVFLRQGLTP